MYGEMLKSGWVAEAKKPEYYDYIFNESERLSRLINNVLLLSNISHERRELQLQPLAVNQLIDFNTFACSGSAKRQWFRSRCAMSAFCGTSFGER